MDLATSTAKRQGSDALHVETTWSLMYAVRPFMEVGIFLWDKSSGYTTNLEASY